MGENDESVDVDNLLEQAFQRVEDSDKNGKEGKSKHPMDDIIMNEAKKAGLGTPALQTRMMVLRKSEDRITEDAIKAPLLVLMLTQMKIAARVVVRSAAAVERSAVEAMTERREIPPEIARRRRAVLQTIVVDPRSVLILVSESTSLVQGPRIAVAESAVPETVMSVVSACPVVGAAVLGLLTGLGMWVVVTHRHPGDAHLHPDLNDYLDRKDEMLCLSLRGSHHQGCQDGHDPGRARRKDHLHSSVVKNTRPRDLEEFFSSVGHVRDVRIITDSKTRRSKGIAYVEFWEREGVPLAMGLNGQKLVGCPLVIQMTCAERNRVANSTMGGAIGFGLSNSVGPLKICISNLHSHINDDMLSAIFEPFGKIEKCSIERDSTGSSKGIGFVTFRHTEEGKRAMEQLNGFELAGRNIRLTTIDDEPQQPQAQQQQLSLDAEDRMNLNSQGRQQLMQKLAHGTGMELPSHQIQAPPVHYQGKEETLVVAAAAAPAMTTEGIPAIATQCFMLSNMFDPASESEPGWELDVRDDVIEECQSCVHIYVDKASESGNVYVKCPTAAIAYNQ
uniref:RRM domain-containing protein n=1 Tax=Ditylenchus dipsaci TaxID=166011 RepID=A0A915E670_9BILA